MGGFENGIFLMVSRIISLRNVESSVQRVDLYQRVAL